MCRMPVNEFDNQRQHCALRQDEAINLVIFAHAIDSESMHTTSVTDRRLSYAGLHPGTVGCRHL